jgi:hypothetical protein
LVRRLCWSDITGSLGDPAKPCRVDLSPVDCERTAWLAGVTQIDTLWRPAAAQFRLFLELMREIFINQ